MVTRFTMRDDDSASVCFVCFLLFILITAISVAGDSLDSDREVLLSLKSHIESLNPQNRGMFAEWVKEKQGDVCKWPRIICTRRGSRVTGINLSDSTIAGALFGNFSALTQLTYLDLSRNTIGGTIPDDLSRCHNLKHLNLSHNILHGELTLPGLSNLEVLDLSLNRIGGDIQSSFPWFCNSLIVANLSANNFTGRMDNIFNGCLRLKYVDFSSNGFSGEVWTGFGRLVEFSVADNHLSGNITASMFRGNCILEVLDLSGNHFGGAFPGQVSNCQNLSVLNLWGNNFEGNIPAEIGSISSLRGLYLGDNTFSRDIPETLLNLTNLVFLDLSRNKFGGDIQEIFGRFTQVKYLVLHGNSYFGGIESSNILKLPNLLRLDLGYNNFSGQLPAEISQNQSLKFLILAYNNFSGEIPQEYGKMPGLQALDLSFNRLTGSIPASFGNLTSLLWLMLANNSLSGEIPREIGNCRSLLWFNVANNQLSGRFHPELTKMGSNPLPTFEVNRQNDDKIIAGSGQCLMMKRWIPAEFPPFNFVYTILTKESCRSLWDSVLKGYGLFPVCNAGSTLRTFEISAYLQLSGNKLSGEVPAEIFQMDKLSTLHLGFNEFEGTLPPEIGRSPLAFLNLTRNKFSGQIPREIGNLKCLQNLDLSYNNFSGNFPTSLNDLIELSKFNISYNPFISGTIPRMGQIATFDKESFLGNPLLQLPGFFNPSGNNTSTVSYIRKSTRSLAVIWVSLAIALAFIACLLVVSVYLCRFRNRANNPAVPSTLEVFHEKISYGDLRNATNGFSSSNLVGSGSFGTVFKALLPTENKVVAVKVLNLQRPGAMKSFMAECVSLKDIRHRNLVKLLTVCVSTDFQGNQFIALIYDFMANGSLDMWLHPQEMEEIRRPSRILTLRERLNIAIHVASALDYLHVHGHEPIAHCDLKPSNVLLDKNLTAHVSDFGLARLLLKFDQESFFNQLSSAGVRGTIGYAAPEYGTGGQPSIHGDVYSFGILLLEMFTGKRPTNELFGGNCTLYSYTKSALPDRVLDIADKSILHVGLRTGFYIAECLTLVLKVGLRCCEESPTNRLATSEVAKELISIRERFFKTRRNS